MLGEIAIASHRGEGFRPDELKVDVDAPAQIAVVFDATPVVWAARCKDMARIW